jgi:hypothetical protein
MAKINKEFNKLTHKILLEAREKGAYLTRKDVRALIKKRLSYNMGKLGKSDVAGLESRRFRREVARAVGKKFEPVMN